MTREELAEMVKQIVNDAVSGKTNYSEKPSLTDGKVFLNKGDVCKYFGISTQTLNKWIANNSDFPMIRIEGCYRFKAKEVEEWLRKHNQAKAR